jgi:hypothetical protein
MSTSEQRANQLTKALTIIDNYVANGGYGRTATIALDNASVQLLLDDVCNAVIILRNAGLYEEVEQVLNCFKEEK